MINRSQIITQKIVAKSTGNTLKFAQSSAADARQEAAAKAMYKKKALEFIQDGRLDRIGVASVYFNSLDPTEKMQVINYWKEKMTTGSSKEQAATSFVGGPVDQSWYEANGIIPLSQKGAFESRIKYLDQLASDIKLDMQAASGGLGAGAAASVAGAAGCTRAPTGGPRRRRRRRPAPRCGARAASCARRTARRRRRPAWPRTRSAPRPRRAAADRSPAASRARRRRAAP